MLDDKICKLREQLNDSILECQDYNIIYKMSTDLDELIYEYYNKTSIK